MMEREGHCPVCNMRVVFTDSPRITGNGRDVPWSASAVDAPRWKHWTPGEYDHEAAAPSPDHNRRD